MSDKQTIDELRAQLAALEGQEEKREAFRDHLSKCAAEVATWPQWKREALGRPIATCSRGLFETWVLETEHPVIGWVGVDWLDQGDVPNTYANDYIQGAWVMWGHLNPSLPAAGTEADQALTTETDVFEHINQQVSGKLQGVYNAYRVASPASAHDESICATCHGEGEVWTGTQHFEYMSMQPPEPIMEACPECGGDTETTLAHDEQQPVARVVDFGHRDGWVAQGIVLQWCAGVKPDDYVNAKLYTAPIAQTEQQPIYLYRRKGQDAFATCDENRFEELSAHHLFETKVAYATPVAQTAPPAAQDVSGLVEALRGMLQIYGVTEAHLTGGSTVSDAEVECCNKARAALSAYQAAQKDGDQ